MAYTLRNHSVDYLTKLDLNAEFLSRPSLYPTKRIDITLSINPDINTLISQSLVFSEELLSYGFLDYRRIFSEKYNDRIKEKASKLYIYSFYKALYTGSKFNLVLNKLPDSDAFIGHCIFCRMLVEQNFVFESNDHRIYVSINFNDNDLDSILLNLEETFPFLKDTKTISANNDTFIFSSDFDACFSRLNDHVKNSDRKDLLLIKRLNDQSIIDMCKSADNPIINGVYSSDYSRFMYVPSTNLISTDISYFISRANFMFLQSISGISDNPIDYFKIVDLNDSLHLITHDVRAITYLMPKYIGVKEQLSKLSYKIFKVDLMNISNEFDVLKSEKNKSKTKLKDTESIDPKYS